jgi:hypothetical protein
LGGYQNPGENQLGFQAESQRENWWSSSVVTTGNHKNLCGKSPIVNTSVGRVSEKMWQPVRVSSQFWPWIPPGMTNGDILFETRLLILNGLRTIRLKPFFIFFNCYPIKVLKSNRIKVLVISEK